MNDPQWQKAKIIRKEQTAEDIMSLFIKSEERIQHRAGQHYQVRLAGQDLGRDYSIASSPLDELVEFGIQLIPSGEISPKLWALHEGDELEIKGPLGESFIWHETMTEPIVLLGAGSGITPLLSIYRHSESVYPVGKRIFIMSAKSPEKIMYYDKLKDHLFTKFTSTQGRIDESFLQQNLGDNLHKTRIYVCGPIEFIDDMVDYLLELGIEEDMIKAESFI